MIVERLVPLADDTSPVPRGGRTRKEPARELVAKAMGVLQPCDACEGKFPHAAALLPEACLIRGDINEC